METKVRIIEGHDRKEVATYTTKAFNKIGELAIILVEKWGMVAAADGGEDSTGRQRPRLLSPDEVVERAFVIAEKAFAAASARGLLVDLPDLNEINAEHDARDAAKRAARTARDKATAE